MLYFLFLNFTKNLFFVPIFVTKLLKGLFTKFKDEKKNFLILWIKTNFWWSLRRQNSILL